MTDHVDVSTSQGVLTLTLNRPDKKNALTDAMYGALADALEAAQADPAVRVAVIRGEGGMFCAGNDIADFLGVAAGDVAQAQVFRFIRLLGSFAKPLVAGVKAVLAHIHGDPAWARVIPPLTPLAEAEAAACVEGFERARARRAA